MSVVGQKCFSFSPARQKQETAVHNVNKEPGPTTEPVNESNLRLQGMINFFTVEANLSQVLRYLQPKALFRIHRGIVTALGKHRIYSQLRFQAEEDSSCHSRFKPFLFFMTWRKQAVSEHKNLILAENTDTVLLG